MFSGSISSMRAISPVRLPGAVGHRWPLPRRAGAVRTRSQARCASIRRSPHPGALPFPVPGQRARRCGPGRPPRRPELGPRGPARCQRRRQPRYRGIRPAVPAPVASPAEVTTAREPTCGGALPGCRRVGRQVSCAEQPFEVSHIRRPAPARHAGPAPSSARRLERRAAGFPCWSGARPPRARRRGTPALPGPPPLAGHRAGQPASARPLGAAPPVSCARSVTSITSIPSAGRRPSRLRNAPGSRNPVREISRYSASLAAPVGAPPEYEIFGCGEKPAE